MTTAVLRPLLAALALLFGCIVQAAPGSAEEAGAVQAASGVTQVASGVAYELIGRWDVDKLNQILKVDAPKFFGVTAAYTPARNAVRLYRVTYPSVIPEMGNKPTVASGLLAIPDTGGTSFPMLSYQHGTVYGKQQVPSFPDQSPETQLALAQFAGQGYLVIGADYFGMGVSKDPEGYVVKASQQQATYDMVLASRAVLDQLKIAAPKLFLGGWSQGGFVTMALLEKLEAAGVPVSAAATASGPVDGFALMSGYLDFPRKNDAGWITTIFILSAFSFENYYGEPGLARSLINDAYYDVSRKAYLREPFDAADIPTDVRKLVRAEYFDPRFFAASAYGRLLREKTQVYRWIVQTPVRNYCGDADEAIPPHLCQLAMTYQSAIGGGNSKVEAISTGQTDHRGTYAVSAPQWKTWFDGL
jgi:pimeloyl-ACP methyl ester carboxylesterase